MRLSSVRMNYTDSNARLKRARRLYAYLIFEKVIGDKAKTLEAARVAIDRGLYSEKTGVRGALISLLGYLEKLDMEVNPKAFMDGWLLTVYKQRYYGKLRDWQ